MTTPYDADERRSSRDDDERQPSGLFRDHPLGCRCRDCEDPRDAA